MNPIIISDNRFLDGTPTATDTAAGYDVQNIRDLKVFTSWKAESAGTKYIIVNCGSAKSADALGISRHNLGTAAAAVSVQSSANGSDWTEQLAAFSPTTDKSILKTFTTASAQYWLVKIVTASIAPQIAICLLGVRITFPYPPDSPFKPFGVGIDADSTRSKSGVHLGTVVRFHPFNLKMNFSIVPRTFLDTTFWPFWTAHARLLRPFLWAWDLTTYPDLVYLANVPAGFVYDPDVEILAYYSHFPFEIEGTAE